VGRKTKSENRYFAHRTPDREIVDMTDDLLDQLISDFSETRTSSSAAWTSLLKTGIAIDPSDSRFHSMMFVQKLPEGTKCVLSCRTGRQTRLESALKVLSQGWAARTRGA
jgi:hypothetical protein